MFYRPELMIYLWILPLLAMVILPPVWAVANMLYRSIERSRLADVKGFVDFGDGKSGDALPERRKFPRVIVQGPKVKVAREVNCWPANVVNISKSGICFSEIPETMCSDADRKVKVVFRTRERDYTMFVQPRWRRLGTKKYVMGAEIEKMPFEWENFVTGIYNTSMAKAA